MSNWVNIKGFEGLYQISDLGEIKSLIRKDRLVDRILKPLDNGSGYLFVRLSKYDIVHTHLISRLVALHFIPNPYNLPEVNHKDLNKLNNHKNNLEWVTRLGNMKHATDMGVMHIKNRLTKYQAALIREKYLKENIPVKELAIEFNTSPVSIYLILYNLTFKTKARYGNSSSNNHETPRSQII